MTKIFGKGSNGRRWSHQEASDAIAKLNVARALVEEVMKQLDTSRVACHACNGERVLHWQESQLKNILKTNADVERHEQVCARIMDLTDERHELASSASIKTPHQITKEFQKTTKQ